MPAPSPDFLPVSFQDFVLASVPDFLPGSCQDFLLASVPDFLPNSCQDILLASVPDFLPGSCNDFLLASVPDFLTGSCHDFLPASVPDFLPGTCQDSLYYTYLSFYCSTPSSCTQLSSTPSETYCFVCANNKSTNEPRREKTGFLFAKTKTQISFAVTAKLISAFVFAIRIVQSLYYLHPKFQASSHHLWLYRPVCVGPGRKAEDRFSHNGAQIATHSLS